jgi:transposase
MKMFIEPSDIYMHLEAVDFRKSINGLIVVVEQQLELLPLSDALFVFSNKKRDQLKILDWDKAGFAL